MRIDLRRNMHVILEWPSIKFMVMDRVIMVPSINCIYRLVIEGAIHKKYETKLKHGYSSYDVKEEYKYFLFEFSLL